MKKGQRYTPARIPCEVDISKWKCFHSVCQLITQSACVCVCGCVCLLLLMVLMQMRTEESVNFFPRKWLRRSSCPILRHLFLSYVSLLFLLNHTSFCSVGSIDFNILFTVADRTCRNLYGLKHVLCFHPENEIVYAWGGMCVCVRVSVCVCAGNRETELLKEKTTTTKNQTYHFL